MNPFVVPNDTYLSRLDYTYLHDAMHIASRRDSKFSFASLPPLRRSCTASEIYAKFQRAYSNSGWLLFSLFRTIGAPLCGIAIISCALLFIYAAEPILIRGLINCVEEQLCEESLSKGTKICAVIVALVLLRCVMYNVMYMLQHIAAAKTASALSACVIEKAIKLSAMEYDKQGPGKILYLQNKAKRISRFMPSIQSLVVDPLKLIITLVLFTREVGYGFVLVAAAGMLSLSLNMRINRTLQRLNVEKDHYGKRGMQYISEYIRGIKAIKLNTWEEFAKGRVGEAYEKEKSCDIRIGMWWQLNEAQKEMLSQGIVIAAIFIAYWLEGSLSVSRAYMILVLYQQLRYPLFSLAGLFSRYSETKQNLRLIEDFLGLEEKVASPVPEGKNDLLARVGEMVVSQVTASCYEVSNQQGNNNSNNELSKSDRAKESRKVLSKLNFRVLPGELVGIVGSVGSGKSLLFRCVLGEVRIDEGSAQCFGRVVYLPQEPWIFSDTLRSNIVMNGEFDQPRYDCVITACELKNDIDSLPEKDLTEIGGRGANLSGGQRQRVALARALYNDGDIFIFDDSLSQLDSQAAAKVFHNVLHQFLAGRTRLFVTTNVKWLVDFPRILLLENGSMVREGKYQDLLAVQTFSGLVRESVSPKGRSVSSAVPAAATARLASSSPKGNVAAVPAPSQIEGRVAGSLRLSDLKPFFQNGNASYVVLLAVSILAAVSSEGMRDRWLFTWSNNACCWNFYSYLLVYIAIISVNLLAGLGKQLVQRVYERQFMRQMNGFVMDKTLNAPLWWHDVTSSGKIVRCVSSGFAELLLVVSQAGNVLQNFGVFAIGVYNILSDLPEFSVCLCALVVLIVYLRRTSGGLVAGTMRLEETGEEAANTGLQELLDGLYSLRASKNGYIDWFRKRLYTTLDNQSRAMLVRNFATLWMDIRWKLMTTGVFALVIFTCFARQRFMAAAAVGFTLQYTLKMCWTMELLCMNYEELATYITSYVRLLRFVDSVPAERDVDAKTADNRTIQGRIDIKNLYLRYQEHLPYVIRGANLGISQGDRVGILGRSGTGKSTLLLGLLRIVDQHGPDSVIELDGRDIRKISIRQLRSAVVMVPQEPWLFSGSIRDNIDPTRSSNEEGIMQIFRRLGLDELLDKKLRPRKGTAATSVLEVEVAENGGNLSQGEKQLLCLARAIIKRPPVLLLDESTANLDEATEEKVLSTISETLEADRGTLIMISHKESAFAVCNRLFRVRDGVCEEVADRDHIQGVLSLSHS